MVLGLKTGRVHHYLSDLEYACHLLAEYAYDVADIREQFPLLPWNATQRIADDLGIRHPIYPGTKTPVVMTSDLVLTTRKGEGLSYTVICVKPSSATATENSRARRTMEKLLIEKTFWELRKTPWHLVTEQEIPRTRVRNLDLLRGSMMAGEIDWVNSYMEDFLSAFNSCWRTYRSLHEILAQVEAKTNLDQGQCFSLFSRAVWLRLIPVDLDAEVIHHDHPLRRTDIHGA